MGDHPEPGTLVRGVNRTVKFAEEPIFHHEVDTADYRDGFNETTAQAWYSETEIRVFREEFMRQCEVTMRSHSAPSFPFQPIGKRRLNKESLIISKDATARGMEYVCCYERQRRTSLGRNVIVESSAAGVRGFDLARIASSCNEWAAEIAIKQAMQDARWASSSARSL